MLASENEGPDQHGALYKQVVEAKANIPVMRRLLGHIIHSKIPTYQFSLAEHFPVCTPKKLDWVQHGLHMTRVARNAGEGKYLCNMLLGGY